MEGEGQRVRELRVTAPAYALTPPQIRLSAREWAQRNLFNGTWNTLLTVATFVLLMLVATRLAQWTTHAHWGVIADHPRFWLIGLMPVGLAARAYWAGGLIAVMVPVTVLLARARVQLAALGSAWGGILVAVAWFMSPVRLDQIGGLYLTVLLATIAIAGSFPIGVLVGIGRVSQLPVVRVLSMLYIELIRGIPFIAVLLWFSVFVTLLSGGALSWVDRERVVIVIFTCDYVGELDRAGIESEAHGDE